MDFDPYRQWLKIPPDHQPPDYYTLLGIPNYETDPQRIRKAAVTRYTLVKQQLGGPYDQQAKRILAELSQAMECLVDPEKRKVYDSELQIKQPLEASPFAGPSEGALPRRPGPSQTQGAPRQPEGIKGQTPGMKPGQSAKEAVKLATAGPKSGLKKAKHLEEPSPFGSQPLRTPLRIIDDWLRGIAGADNPALHNVLRGLAGLLVIGLGLGLIGMVGHAVFFAGGPSLPPPPLPSKPPVAQRPPEALVQDVGEAWSILYAEQEKSETWPVELGEEFRTAIRELEPDGEIPPKFCELYQYNILQHFPALYELADIRFPAQKDQSGQIRRDAQGRPIKIDPFGRSSGTPGLGDSSPIDLVGKVDWDMADIERIRDGFRWEPRPTSQQVRLAQEDLWVYEALLGSISQTNLGATGYYNAAVKRIEALEVGQTAAAAFAQASVAAFGPTGGMGAMGNMEEMAGGLGASEANPYGGPSGMTMPGSELSPGPSSAQLEQRLLNFRYVDRNGKPLAAEEKLPLAAVKILPVRLLLIVDQRRIATLLANLANARMPVEVCRVTLNRTTENQLHLGEMGASSDGSSPGTMPGMGMPSGMGMSSGMGTPSGMGMPGAMGAPGGYAGGMYGGEEAASMFPAGSMSAGSQGPRTRHDVPIEIQGLVSIFLPPPKDEGPGKLFPNATAQDIRELGDCLVQGVKNRVRWLELLRLVNACLPKDDQAERPEDAEGIMQLKELHVTSLACRETDRTEDGPRGTGCVVRLAGYHYHNDLGAGSSQGAQFVRDTLINALQTQKIPLPRWRQPEITEQFSADKLGIVEPSLIQPGTVRVETVPKATAASGSLMGMAGGMGYSTEGGYPAPMPGLMPGGMGPPAPGSALEGNDAKEAFLELRRFDFQVEFHWQPDAPETPEEGSSAGPQYAELAERIKVPVEEEYYSHTTLWDPPLFAQRQKRGQPPLYAVEALRGIGGQGAVRMSQQGQLSGPDTKGLRWIVLTGLLPIARQSQAFTESFENAQDWNPPRDTPRYVHYRIQRAEADRNSGGAEPDWHEIDAVRAFADAQAFLATDLAVDPKYLHSQPYGMPGTMSGGSVYGYGGAMGMGGPYGSMPGSTMPPGSLGEYTTQETPAKETPKTCPLAFPTPALASRQWGSEVSHPPEIPLRSYAPDPDSVQAQEAVLFQLFRFFDFDVQPGKDYRYRVKLLLLNPNYRLEARFLEKEELAREPHVETDWSAPSGVISVPPDSGLLAGPVKAAPSGGDEPVASIVALTFRMEDGMISSNDFSVYRGQLANFEGTLNLNTNPPPFVGGMGNQPMSMMPMPGAGMPGMTPGAGMPGQPIVPTRPAQSGEQAEKTTYATDMLVVDIAGGERMHPIDRNLTEPGSLLLLGPDGSLVVRNELDDQKDYLLYHVPEETKRPRRSEAEADESKVPQYENMDYNRMIGDIEEGSGRSSRDGRRRRSVREE